MNVRLRYIGRPRNGLVKDKVYYFQLRQIGLKIELRKDERAWTYSDLETFLKNWKILSIKKELKHVDI